MPGSTPTICPSSTPSEAHQQVASASARVGEALHRARRTVPSSDPQRPERQRHAEPGLEDQEQRRGRRRRDQRPSGAAAAARRTTNRNSSSSEDRRARSRPASSADDRRDQRGEHQQRLADRLVGSPSASLPKNSADRDRQRRARSAACRRRAAGSPNAARSPPTAACARRRRSRATPSAAKRRASPSSPVRGTLMHRIARLAEQVAVELLLVGEELLELLAPAIGASGGDVVLEVLLHLRRGDDLRPSRLPSIRAPPSGAPFGMATPRHIWKFGALMPCSFMVGTSGRPGKRVVAEHADRAHRAATAGGP